MASKIMKKVIKKKIIGKQKNDEDVYVGKKLKRNNDIEKAVNYVILKIHYLRTYVQT